MATIANLAVNLGMNVASFAAGAKTGAKSLQSLAGSALSLNSAMLVAGAAAAGGALIFDQFSRAGSAVDGMNDLANATGFSTEKLAGLQHAAKLSGVESSALDSGLKKLVINLGKGQEAGSAAEEAFTKLGLSVAVLKNQGSDAALNQIADAISRLPTSADKAAAAVAVFGKSGLDLVNVLNEGSAGLARLQAEANAMGLTVTKEEAEKVAAAFDAMDNAGESLTGMFRELAIIAGPTVRLLAQGMTEFLQDVRQGNVGDLLADVATGGINALAEAAEKIERMDADAAAAAKPQKILADAMDEVSESAKRQKKEIDGMDQLYKSLNKEQENRNRIFEAAKTPLEDFLTKQREIYQALTKLNNARVLGFMSDEEAVGQKSGLHTALARLQQDEQKRRQAEFDSNPLVQSAKQRREGLLTPGEILQKELKNIQAELAAGLLNKGQASLASLQAQKSFLETNPNRPTNHPGERPAFLEMGSAAAFSASLSKRTFADKIQAEIKKIDEQILLTMGRIEANLKPTGL